MESKFELMILPGKFFGINRHRTLLRHFHYFPTCYAIDFGRDFVYFQNGYSYNQTFSLQKFQKDRFRLRNRKKTH